MRNDLKAGVVVGVVVVAAAILFFVGRGGDSGLDELVVPVTDEPVSPVVDEAGKPETETVKPLDETQPGLIVVKPYVPEVAEPAVPEASKDPCQIVPVLEAFVPKEPKPKPRIEVDSAAPKVIYHTVGKGESLYKVAESHYGHGRHWKIIYDANRQIIGADSNKLKEGLRLRIPSPDEVANP